ncbi:MAG: HNH endonuclease family protein, partial [Brevundimonas sp.]|nr:HNH endonuclease family protein [Brevundimonas sp.]
RAVMRDGDAADSIPPMAKRIGDVRGVVSLSNYKRLLKKRLLTEFPTRDDWISHASRMPIYSHSVPVSKFLILAASHDTVVDTTHGAEGLLQVGRKLIAPTMTGDAWRSDAVFTVEHIAPQSQSAGWRDEIYEPGLDAVHRLGNLTLLPKTPNSYVSNKSWEHKRLLYRYFSAETPAKADLVYAEFGAAGLAVSKAGDLVLGASPFMPMCSAVSLVPGDWTLDLIERRSIRLAGLAWDRLAPWLD